MLARLLLVLPLLLATPLAYAQEETDSAQADPARAEQMVALARTLADQVAIPGYRAFADRAHALDEKADALCAAPSAAALADARAAYHDASDAWMRVQPLRFGPGEFLMRGFRMAYWPDTRNVVTKQLGALLDEADPDVLDPDRFARSSVAVQGLPALERLLFDDDEALASEAGYRCEVVQAITGNFTRIADGIVEEWTADDGYRAGIAADGEAVVHEFFKAMHSGLEVVADLKLGRPMGETFEDARGKRAENWRSGRAMRNIALNLDGIAAIYEGGLDQALRHAGKDALAASLSDQFAAVTAHAHELGDGMVSVLETPEGYQRLAVLRADVKAVRARVASDMAPALDLLVGFNSLDGD